MSEKELETSEYLDRMSELENSFDDDKDNEGGDDLENGEDDKEFEEEDDWDENSDEDEFEEHEYNDGNWE